MKYLYYVTFTFDDTVDTVKCHRGFYVYTENGPDTAIAMCWTNLLKVTAHPAAKLDDVHVKRMDPEHVIGLK